MAENDIYNSEKRYEDLKENLSHYTVPPRPDENGRKYWIKNPVNLKYFLKLFTKLEARDVSYIRRLRLWRSMLILNHVVDKDLATIGREEIDQTMAFSHKIHRSVETKRTFPLDLKFIWKQMFPEKDERGQIDETLTPYVVRHLSGKVDRSRQKLKSDKFSLDEFEKLVQGFADEPRMQAILTISLESLARPQELLYRKIKDVEMHDNYAKIYITSHGKEGTGFLRVMDSYFYLSQWINKHPLKNDPNAYLFINTGKRNRHEQMTPKAANKLIRMRSQKIGIQKPITLYSLKRNGVTMMRLGGKSDLEIQHTARWTSTKQLKTYDLSNQEESFMQELVKRGKIPAEGRYKDFAPKTKSCIFCGMENGLAETTCATCKRPLNREVIEKQEHEKDKEMSEMKQRMEKVENKETTFLSILKKLESITANAVVTSELKKEIEQIVEHPRTK